MGTRLERPSKRASACERFDLRTRVETDEEVAFVATDRRRIAVSGAGVREMVRDGRGTSRTEMEVREGRRGGADLGTWGSVAEGAGLGEGIDRKESESDNFGGGTCFRFKLAERIDWDSAKSRERKDLYSGLFEKMKGGLASFELSVGRLPRLIPSKMEWQRRPEVKKGE